VGGEFINTLGNPHHIGIVGCSYEGAALCYRTICQEGAIIMGEHAHPEISMHTYPLAAYVDYIRHSDWEGVGSIMLASAKKLAAIGATFVICPDNTIHQSLPFIKDLSPIPWLHIAEVVAQEAELRNFKNIGLTGTQWMIESEIYPEKLSERGIGYLRPSFEECTEMNRIIMDELVFGTTTAESVTYFQGVMNNLKAKGCDAVVLGCTEIPLLMNDFNSPLPTLDSNRLLARAALKRSLGL
jgi:aspartate racemase